MPVIIGEAPPSTWEYPCARRMFADRHTDYSGPDRVGTSAAQTRLKKNKASKARDFEHPEGVMYPRLSAHPVKFVANGIARPPPPSRPFKVVARPITNQQTPPPARPFQAAVKSAVPMASKAAMQEVIELTSASEGSKDATAEEPDTEYEDDLRGNKRKLKSGNSSRTSKKRASSEAIIEPKKEGVRFKAKPLKPSPSDASPLKGGPLSPLTVGSSSVDEERSSGNEGLCYMCHMSFLAHHLIQLPSQFDLQFASGTVLPKCSQNSRVRICVFGFTRH
jgi:hypothetical protein